MLTIIDDLVDRSVLERLIARFGGESLAHANEKARDLRKQFELTITEEQRLLYLDAEDARSDASGAREEGLMLTVLGLGVGVGTAIAYVQLCPESAIKFGASIATAVMAVDRALHQDKPDIACKVSVAVSKVLDSLGRPAEAEAVRLA